jgi:hypothetical protein
MSKSRSQRLEERLELLVQWIKSNILVSIVATVVAGHILSYIGNPFAKPDVTVEGGATAESCRATVTDTQTQKDIAEPNRYSVASKQSHSASVPVAIPELRKGQKSDRRKYRIRAKCSNDVSPYIVTYVEVTTPPSKGSVEITSPTPPDEADVRLEDGNSDEGTYRVSGTISNVKLGTNKLLYLLVTDPNSEGWYVNYVDQPINGQWTAQVHAGDPYDEK